MTRKKVLLTSLSFIILITFTNTCFAINIPGLGINPSLQDYIKAVFNAIMIIAGIIAAIAFTIGAMQYMTSAGNPTSVGEGRKKMISAVMGLVLLMGSVVLLNLINPQITKLDIASGIENLGAGLFLIGDNKQMDAPPGLPDTQVLPSWATTLQYKCLITPQDYYMVYSYPTTGYQGRATVQKLECNKTVSIGEEAESYALKKITAGVYFFSTCNDWNTVTGPFSSSQKNIANLITSAEDTSLGFNGKVACIKIVNRPDKQVRFAALPHEGTDFQGKCSWVLRIFSRETIGENTEQNYPMEVISPSSFTIAQITRDTGGDGIVVYSESGFNGGYIKVTGKYIGEAGLTRTGSAYLYTNTDTNIPINVTVNSFFNAMKTINPKFPEFDYTGVNIPNEQQKTCNTIIKAGQQICPGSIKNNGSYLLVIHGRTAGNRSFATYCDVIPPLQDVQNLFASPALKSGRVLDLIEIFSTK